MSTNGTDSVDFVLEEYKDCYENIMHLENKLFNHLSLYTTLFLGLVAASSAIVQLGSGSTSGVTGATVWFGLLLLMVAFVIVSRFELRMTTELRVRKIKFVEAITQVRQCFVERDHSISDYLILPVGLRRAPPYLRARSHDWYHVLYLSLMNGCAVFAAWVCFLQWLSASSPGLYATACAALPVQIWVVATLIGALLFYVVFWELSYKSVQELCEFYDKDRIKRMGAESAYDLLERPVSRNWLRRSFGDWIWIIESWGKRHNAHRDSAS